jgi:hypothetical protein
MTPKAFSPTVSETGTLSRGPTLQGKLRKPSQIREIRECRVVFQTTSMPWLFTIPLILISTPPESTEEQNHTKATFHSRVPTLGHMRGPYSRA